MRVQIDVNHHTWSGSHFFIWNLDFHSAPLFHPDQLFSRAHLFTRLHFSLSPTFALGPTFSLGPILNLFKAPIFHLFPLNTRPHHTIVRIHPSTQVQLRSAIRSVRLRLAIHQKLRPHKAIPVTRVSNVLNGGRLYLIL